MVTKLDYESVSVSWRYICEVCLSHLLLATGQAFKIWVVADQDNTIFCASDVSLNDSSQLLACFEGLKRILRVLNGAASVSE